MASNATSIASSATSFRAQLFGIAEKLARPRGVPKARRKLLPPQARMCASRDQTASACAIGIMVEDLRFYNLQIRIRPNNAANLLNFCPTCTAVRRKRRRERHHTDNGRIASSRREAAPHSRWADLANRSKKFRRNNRGKETENVGHEALGKTV